MKRKKYSVVVADCPWPFNDKLPGKLRGAEKNYSVMSIEDICGMQRGGDWKSSDDAWRVPPTALALCGKKFRIADDALLFLWRVASMQQEALDVIDAWGFELKTELVWIKTTDELDATVTSKKHYGKSVKTYTLHFGMGRIVRAAHETCLIAARGAYMSRVSSHSVRSVFVAPVPRDEKGKIIHSAKPDKFYSIVEELASGEGPQGEKARKLELFARRRRENWKCIGNEVK